MKKNINKILLLSFVLLILPLITFSKSEGDFFAKISKSDVQNLRDNGYELKEIKLESSPDLYLVKRENVSTFSILTQEIIGNKIREKYDNKQYKVTTNDTYYNNQWGLPKVKAPEAWAVGATGSNAVTVAVLDTGLGVGMLPASPVHEDMVGRIWTNTGETNCSDVTDNDGNTFVDDCYGWDFVDSESNPAPADGGGASFAHGTMVSGVIAANTSNSKGIAGLDQNVKIMPVRVCDNSGSCDTAEIAQGVQYARIKGANVINMSLGLCHSGGADPVLQTQINLAYAQGVTVVAASGNSADDGALDQCPFDPGVNYPAAGENVIAAGSTDSADVKSSFSSYGPELDLVAPGSGIYTTNTTWNGSAYTTNQYCICNGTSFSSPHVAAAASILKASNGSLTPLQIRNILTGNTDKVSGMSGQDFTNLYGYGRLNILNSYNNYNNTLTRDYSFLSATNPPSQMTPGQTANVQIHLTNTGGSTWYNEGSTNPMRLAVLNEDGKTFWPNNDTWIGNDRIAMTSPVVGSGQVGSFNFTIKAPSTPGVHTLRFMPVVEGVQALKDIGMQFVVNTSYDYNIYAAQNPPTTMTPGNTSFVQIHLKNTGAATWYNEGNANPMRLAVLNADGKTFWPNNDTWVGNDRIAMTSPSVAPGQIGTFAFTMKAPAVAGTHTMKFLPVVEGKQALRDIGMQFVTSIGYDYNIVSAVNPPSTMTANSTAFVQIHLKNTGGSTWYNEGNANPMRLAVLNADGKTFWPNNDTWVGNDRIAMTSPSVAPGQIGTFAFTVKAPASAGPHLMQFLPVVEGVQALRDIGMQFGVVVQ